MQKAIERDGSFCPKGKGSFCVQDVSHTKPPYYLSQLLYGVYHHKPMSWVKAGRVNFLDGNTSNLTKANLSHTHADEEDNINRRIWREGEYIFLHHKKSGQCYFCSYTPVLFDLLCSHRILWGYQPDMGRLQATVIWKKRKMKGFAFGFHTLCYASYHYGAGKNNFIGRVKQMQKDFSAAHLSVDHLDDNQANNCIWNLSPMRKEQNAGKKDILGCIRYPFFFYAVYFDGEYRVVCGRICGDVLYPGYDAAFVICADPPALIELAKRFYKTEWEDGVSPEKKLKSNPDNVCLQNYFGDFGATGIRKLLLEKNQNEFETYKMQ